MTEYRVGERISPNMTQFSEGLHILGLSAERQDVVVAFNDLSEDEIQGFRTGPFDVAIATAQELGILLVRCAGSNGWMDVEWDIRRYPEAERTPLSASYTLVVWFLVDANTGIIRAMRQATLSPAFSERLGKTATRQLTLPFSERRHAQLIGEYQQQSSEQLARKAWVSESLGLSEPPAPQPVKIIEMLAAAYPSLDSRVREVMAEALVRREARIEQRGTEDWWIDPSFGEDTPILKLGYDETFGLVDRRSHPESGKA